MAEGSSYSGLSGQRDHSRDHHGDDWSYSWGLDPADNSSIDYSPAPQWSQFNAQSLFNTPSVPTTDTSTNWSGAVMFASSGESFGAVSAQWVVPSVTQVPLGGVTTTDIAEWVGLDGYNSSDVSQAGVMQVVQTSGGQTTITTEAWVEWFPAYAVELPASTFAVNPGNTISVTVETGGAGSTTSTFILDNVTTGQIYETSMTAPSGTVLLGDSAEIIAETPEWTTGNQVSQPLLTDFLNTPVVFQDVGATFSNGSSASLSSAQTIGMVTNDVPHTSGYLQESYGSIQPASDSVTVTEDNYWGGPSTSNSITVAGTSSDALQGGAAVALLASAPVITDSSANLASVTVQIAKGSGSPVSGDQLFVNGQQSGTLDGGLVSVSWNSSTDSLKLTGNVPIAEYQTLLSEVTYRDTGTDTTTSGHPVRTVTWTVNDGTSTDSTTSSVTIDRSPVANNVTASDSTGSPLTATATTGVLSHDSDPDGDTLTVTGISYGSHVGTVGQTLAGAYGTLTLNANGSYSYASNDTAPPSGGTPTDTFTYTLSDGAGGTATASLNLTVNNAPVFIESYGVTALTEQANNYFLVPIGGGHAPSVKENGVPVAASGLPMQAIGAEATASGYELAWHFTGQNLYTVWNLDSNGNYVSDTIGNVAGNSAALEALEPSFQQDLNGDGFIGVVSTVEAYGSTSLQVFGGNYYLDPVSGGAGPELKFGGSPVTVGQFGAWIPIAAESTASGYEVALQNNSLGLDTVWVTDGNGNDIGNAIGAVSGTSAVLESYELSFHQDLNGDGFIGAVSTVEADGSTSLQVFDGNYYLDPVSGGAGPELKFGGSPVTVGQFGAWIPIGAESTASGYEVALQNNSLGLDTVWVTDSNGNDIGNAIGAVSGTSAVLESYELSFHQDLNGDGTIGPPGLSATPTTVIESDGATALVETGNNYFMNPVSGGTGPELEFGGALVTVGQFGAWTPIGAEATASGYEVAFQDGSGSAALYTVWNTDSNGNDIGNAIGAVSGTSAVLESYELSFHQDLNGDGTIGPTTAPTTTVIESDGATALVGTGDNYFMNPVSGGTGPELKFGGSPVTVGQFGAWTPIGAEATASGYEVALQNGSDGAALYTVWNTDSNGNDIGNAIGAVSGTSAVLESYELSFHQDLNGDGTIGLPATQAADDTPTASLIGVPDNHDSSATSHG